MNTKSNYTQVAEFSVEKSLFRDYIAARAQAEKILLTQYDEPISNDQLKEARIAFEKFGMLMRQIKDSDLKENFEAWFKDPLNDEFIRACQGSVYKKA